MIKDITLTIVEYSKELTEIESRRRQIYSALRMVCIEVGKHLLQEELNERRENESRRLQGDCKRTI